jgi:cell division topological specificity factor
MIEFLKRIFNPAPSSVTARERLRLVLLSDHLALAPDVVESLKADLIAVMSKYVDVDIANCDVTFEQQESVVAMLANIPILGMKPANRTPRPAPPILRQAQDDLPPMTDTAPASAAVADAPEASDAPAEETSAPAAPPGPKPRRRRRRRASVNAAPAH